MSYGQFWAAINRDNIVPIDACVVYGNCMSALGAPERAGRAVWLLGGPERLESA